MSRFKKLPEGVRTLSESEIQDRLYGRHHVPFGKRVFPAAITPLREPDALADPSAAMVPPRGTERFLRTVQRPGEGRWTGAEILSGELSRLRSELVSLRRQRDDLMSRLGRLPQFRRGGSWPMVRLLALLILAALVLYPAGAGLLQASPMGAEPTPYTVQVAVYDVRSYADEAVRYLRRLGYPAFGVQMKRMNGRLRYRIYMGSFVTKEEATLAERQLTQDPRFKDFEDAFARLF